MINSICELLLGPILTITENVIAGYFLENVKVEKQLYGKSYKSIIKKVINKNGYIRTYYPYGLLQAVTKGAPLLVVSRKVKSIIKPYDLNPYLVGLMAGSSAGTAQACIVTPTQRLKTVIWTENINFKNALIKCYNTNTLLKGLIPTIARRSIDCSIRSMIVGPNVKKENYFYNFGICGLAAWVCASVTMPFDNLIARRQVTQKDFIYQKNVYEHFKNIYKKEGIINGLYRGYIFRMIDSCHHTFWLFIVANAMLDSCFK